MKLSLAALAAALLFIPVAFARDTPPGPRGPLLDNVHCARGVCWTAARWARRAAAQARYRREAEEAIRKLQEKLKQRPVITRTVQSRSTDWRSRQIAAAEMLGRESNGDPWPNCPDPYDGGGSWDDTANCENGGNWYDSPGFYRCGLQFDPMWERRFGDCVLEHVEQRGGHR